MANNTLILTSGSATFTIPAGGTQLTEIFGTSGTDNINIEAGAKVLFKSGFTDANDKIYIQGDAADFQVSVPSALSSTITLDDGSGNTIVIPAGSAGQTLIFDDGSTTLKIDAGVVELGGTAVTTTEAPVTVTTPTPSTPTFTLTGAATVAEGTELEFTIKASEVSDTDKVFNITVAGDTLSGAVTAADPAKDFSTLPTTVTLPANAESVTFKITPTATDGAESSEGAKVSILDGTTVANSASFIITDSTDTVAPTMAAQKFNYNEGQTSGATVATVEATDNVGITKYEIVSGNDASYFDISNDGKITLTSAGAAAGSAANSSLTDPDSFTLGIKASDAAGNATTSNMTLNVIDAIAPTLVTNNPATLGGQSISLTFNEALDGTSIPAGSAFTVLQNGSTSVTVNTVTVNGSAVTLGLASAPAGTVTVSYTPPATTPLQDLAGNDVNAISAQTVITDATAPTLTTSSPVDGAATFAVADPIVLTFSESIKAGTGNIKIVSVNGTDNRTISITDAQVKISGNQITIDPTADLGSGMDYSIQIDAGAVEDTSGNDFAGITNTTTLNFTTAQPVSDRLTSGSDVKTANNFDGSLEILSGQSVETLTNGDRLTGTGTNTTLFAQIQQYAHTVTPLSMTGIQTVNIDASTLLPTQQNPAPPTLNFANVDSSVNNFGLSGQTANFTLTNIPNAISAFGINNNTNQSAFTATFQNTALSTTTNSTTVTLNQVTAAANGATPVLTFQPSSTASGFETINVVSGGSLANAATLTDGNGNSLATVNISGVQGLTLTLADTTVTTVNATDSTGGVTVVAAAANAQNMSVTGGSGNDLFDVNGYTASDVISGGSAGTDILRMTNAEATGVATAQSNITGIDTIALNNAAAVAVANTPGAGGFSGTATLGLFGATAATGATGFRLGGSTDNTAVADSDVNDVLDVNSGLAGAGTLNYSTGAANSLSLQNSPSNGNRLDVKVSGSATTDAVSVIAGTTTQGILTGTNGSGWGNAVIIFDGTETVNLTSRGGANIFGSSAAAIAGSAPAGSSIFMTPSASNEILNIDGNQNLTILGTITTDTIAAGTFTGNLLMGVPTTATAVTGGSGADILQGAANGAGVAGDVIIGGDGTDTLIGNTGVDILTGGTGADNFVFAPGDTFTAANTPTSVDKISDLVLGNTGTFDTVGIGGVAGTIGILNAGAAYTGTINAAAFDANIAAPATLTVGGNADAYLVTATAGDQVGKTFLVVDVDNNNAIAVNTDIVIDVTGFTGALTTSNIVGNGMNLTGGAGVDVLTGTTAGDTLNGGLGADTINGGNGSDTLSGGTNVTSVANDDDVFQLTGRTAITAATVNVDTITDFYAGSTTSIGGVLANTVDEIQFGSTFLGNTVWAVSANASFGTTVASGSAGHAGFDSTEVNTIYMISDGTAFVESGVAQFAGSGSAGFSVAGSQACIFIADDANGNANIWYINDSLDNTATDVTVNDVVLIGVLTGVRAANLVAGDFAGATI